VLCARRCAFVHCTRKTEELTALCTTVDGGMLSSVSLDQTAKIYDVKNFDMINILNLGFEPLAAEFISLPDSAKTLLAM
jgi:peptidylprolyl isomerase domain and WD repeat-containing protein 1